MTKNQIIDNLREYLTNKVEFALIFGTLVSDRFTEKSDVDIGVYLKNCDNKSLPFTKKMEIISEISSAIGRDADIIFLNESDPIITMQVFANGELIMNNNHHLFYQFKANAISLYIDIKMGRKIIEDNLLKGSLYA